MSEKQSSTEKDQAVLNPRSTKRNWAPYWLILPALIYLALFFAWPMFRGLSLAVWDDEAILRLHTEADVESEVAGSLPQGTQVAILESQGNVMNEEALAESNLVTEIWFRISTEDAAIQGWTSEARVRVREEDDAGNATVGSIRRKLASGADPQTEVYAEPNAASEIIGKLDANQRVNILAQTTLEVWYLISGEEDGKVVEGWTPSRYIQTYGEGETGRIDSGNAGELTAKYFQRMVNDRFFWPAMGATFLLMILIIPVQFVLAIIMALVIQAQLKGNSFFLYVFAIALGVSDLAAGIVWFSIFTQYGFLNTILQGLGLIDAAHRLPDGADTLLDHHCHLAGRSLARHSHRHGHRRLRFAGHLRRGHGGRRHLWGEHVAASSLRDSAHVEAQPTGGAHSAHHPGLAGLRRGHRPERR